jgi:hypothetical protein
MVGFVYRYTNKLNGKWYIGSHKGHPDDGYTASGVLIKQSFAKHGMESFDREILYQGPNYISEERKLLTELNAAKSNESYNLINTASDNLNGYRLSGDDHPMKRPEVALKVSKSKKGKFNSNGHLGLRHSEETKDKMSQNNAMKRPECQQKLSKSRTGMKFSDEHRENMSKTKKGVPWSKARRDAQNNQKGK